MQKLFRFLSAFLILPVLLTFSSVPHVSAAEFRSGEEVRVTETSPLDDPYVFGGNIQIDSPITNELTAAGGDLNINSQVGGSALVAGGNILFKGSVGNNARVAGGNITIDGPVTNDLVIAGGSVKLTRNASIGGDLIFTGGTITVDGPVAGNVAINGGDAVLNSTVGGNVQAEEIEKLQLGENAIINGNLTYRSPERAQIAQGAAVQGRTDYRQSEEKRGEDNAAGFLTGAAIYKLITDIIISLLLVYFFRRAFTYLVRRIKDEPLRSGVIGFAWFFLAPIAAGILLLLFWLGITSFLFYALTWIVALYILKIFLGWIIMHWWKSNKKEEYVLDWRAAVIGPIVLFLLALIPILGWLTIAILFLMSLGALIEGLIKLASNQKELPNTKHLPTKRK